MRFGRFEEPSSGHTLAQGDMLYYDLGLGGWNIVPVGTNDQVLKVDGAATTAIKDSGATGHVCTLTGTAVLSTTQKKLGNGGLYLDGDSDYVTVPDSADFEMASGDFTLEAFIRLDDVTNRDQFIIAKWLAAGNQREYVFGYKSATSDNKLYFSYTTAGTFTPSGVDAYSDALTMSNGTWYHVAFVRNGNTGTFYLDGVAKGTVDLTGKTIFGGSAQFLIGAQEDGGHYLDGYIDEVRVSKGIARWTTDFTAPTTAYTSDSYTKLLLHCDLVPVWRT